MQEITQYSFNGRDLMIIMEVIDKRLNDSGKNWRHVFKVGFVNKALTLIQYMLENGPEDVIRHCKANLHSIKTLREFQYIDETGHDQGANGDIN
jgi:epsin